MTRRTHEFGAAELDVLKVLWDTGPATVREVMTELHRRGRRIAYTTVQTLLRRLEQKDVVASDKSDLAFVFRPKVSKEKVRRSRLKTLVGQLYDGAPGSLALHLVRTQRLSAEEIAELHDLINRLDQRTDAPEP